MAGNPHFSLLKIPTSRKRREKWGTRHSAQGRGKILIRTCWGEYESENYATGTGWRAGCGIGDWADWGGCGEVAGAAGGEESSACDGSEWASDGGQLFLAAG